jgi:glyoxylase-like metal-dependent hydrolase (beta-lactamase superfamily II)
VQLAGFGLDEIRAIVLSHLHLDHAGGLEFFRGRNVPIYVHADELKHAFYAVATGEDLGAYIPHYLDFSFNWQALDGEQLELFAGVHLLRLAGHTPALLGLRLDLLNAVTFLFTSDRFHLRDNYAGPQPLGWLLRDHAAWWRSYRQVKTLADRTDAKLVFGHDADVLAELKRERFYD